MEAADSQGPPSDAFRDVLEACAAKFQYAGAVAPRESITDGTLLVPAPESLVRFLPFKADWAPSELLCFEGAEFVFAATRSLQCRAPTQEEAHGFASSKEPHAKLEFLLKLDAMNRATRERGTLTGAGRCRWWWNIHQGLKKRGWSRLAKLAKTLFNRSAKSLTRNSAADMSLRLLLLAFLDRYDRQQRAGPA